MSDSESIKKMLRAVLQSSKTGVSISSVQSDYWSLCGENIPLKKLGYSKLEDYLRSIPSVVRLAHHMGELRCFAAVCKETAHIAELVARQKDSKKRGGSRVVNCKMRFKSSNPYMLNVRPTSSLRQPSLHSASNLPANQNRPHGGYRGFSATGDYRQLDKKLSSITPVEHRHPAPQAAVTQTVLPNRGEKTLTNGNKFRAMSSEKVSGASKSQCGVYDVVLVQSKLTLLLEKYSSGVWLSKLPAVYNQMFSQKLHPQALIDLESWSHICMLEKTSTSNQVDRLIYPPLPSRLLTAPSNGTSSSSPTSPISSSATTTLLPSCPSKPKQLSTSLPASPVYEPRVFPKSPLAVPTFIFPLQPAAAAASAGNGLSRVTLRSPTYTPTRAPQLPPCVNPAESAMGDFKGKHNPNHNQNNPPLSQTWAEAGLPSTNTSAEVSSVQPGDDILPLLKVTFSPPANSGPCFPSKSSAVTVSAEERQRIKELLHKCSHGLWAHALPKLFMDTYKTPFPEHVLDNLSLLLDICTLEYPSREKKKAILYYRANTEPTDSQGSQQYRSPPLPSGVQVLGSADVPVLVLPSEQYPSVLVTEVKSSNAVTIRYVGENYSNAQEAMEDAMLSFYSQSSTQHPLSDLMVGQLVAVKGEDGDELARAQVVELLGPNKVKVYYVDYGFSVETSRSDLLELHKDFLSLPFQATNARLAGLDTFSSHPSVLSTLDKLAVGKILLMETLEPCQQSEIPVAVLYDTSQDVDININSICLKALQDMTMNNPLTINVTYQNVRVTNVSAEGFLHCQLPSRGTTRLSKLLEEIEAYFISQVTSESLVSRLFNGKLCLVRYKGKWARAEITNIYANRVVGILFIDLGIPATLEVTELREVPPFLLKDFIIIPPQAIKCCLADLTVPDRDWSPKAVQWIKEAVLGSVNCKMKILKLDQDKEDKLVYMYLFINVDSQDLHNSINHQLAQSQLWLKLTAHNNNIITSVGSSSVGTVEKWTLKNPLPETTIKSSTQPCLSTEEDMDIEKGMQPLSVPPPLELPQPGQNMDVFVPVACHPGYFVLQPWQDLHKLVVLMGEMVLYYNQSVKTTTTIQRGEIYAARIDKNWHRVKVKGILANGLVSVYELDHGKHELVHSSAIRQLIEEFRQLPFQAIPAQLACVTQHQWSEEASMVFRNHVEKRSLVAQVDSVQEVSEVKGELWERRLTVYLVDTTLEDRDIWIHSIVADMDAELAAASNASGQKSDSSTV